MAELWRFNGITWEINVLHNGAYVQCDESLHFPGLSLTKAIPEDRERSKIEGRNKTMKGFRALVRQQLE